MPPNQNTNKTKCHAGHPFDDSNTYIEPTGKRRCLECARQRRNDRRRTQRLEEKREMGLIYQTLGSIENDVWCHVAQGLTNKQIGNELGMTEGNVEWWVSQLLSRFEITNRVQLAKMHWSNQQVNIRGL